MPAIENQTLSKLYYSIGEVASMLQVNASLLRFWEKEFNLTVSKKNKKGNRLFSVKEIEQIQRIYHFVKVEGYTLEGAKKALKQKPTAATAEPVLTDQKAVTEKPDFSEIIGKLEGIKAKLLSLPVQTETAQEVATPSLEKAIIPSKPIVKKAPEKPKPASDMPTLFDF